MNDNGTMSAHVLVKRVLAAAIATLIASFLATTAESQDVERGKYLVTFGGCFDCHTPGYFFGKPDMARYLAGSEVGFEVPGLGVFYGTEPDP